MNDGHGSPPVAFQESLMKGNRPRMKTRTTLRLTASLGAGLLLAACAAIEIPSNPQMPKLRANAEAARAEQATTSATTSRAVPGGVPVVNLDVPTSGALNLTVPGVIAMALARNRELAVDKISPMIQETYIATQRAAFDPTFSADMKWSRTHADTTSSIESTGSVGLSEFLPTGTTVGVTLTGDQTRTSGSGGTKSASSVLGLSITQSLLKGGGIDVNLVSLNQAKNTALKSQYELRGYVATIISNVEQAYWTCLLDEKTVKIYEDALAVAQRQLNETLERIKYGKLAETERYSAESEVASRKETLINGRSDYDKAKLALLRLVSPPGGSLRNRSIRLMSDPILPNRPNDAPEKHVKLALRMRPDLNQARLQWMNDDLDVVTTKNGLLPKLDLFVNLGKTGYANTISNATNGLDDSNANNASVELKLTYALGNRAARAAQRRSELTREQQAKSVGNMEELAEQDVRDDIIEVQRLHEQIAATAVARKLTEETLRAEQEKYRVGRATLLDVAVAERDLLNAQINEAQAHTGYLNDIVTLYADDGSLLTRRGVACPGDQPVKLKPAWDK
jgi:outer membrane protein TolC